MKPARTHRKPRGFALIVTLSLLMLLTVIAVGLLSLSSISMRSSRQSSDAQTAQANARMALMIAISQLQKYAGPDQRATGKADLAAGPLGASVADATLPINQKAMDLSDQGLVQVQPGTRHWTGIWKNNSLNPGLDIYTKTPSPQFLQWLVSGNEVTANSVKPDTTLYGVDSNGKSKLDPKNQPYAVVLAGPATVGAASSSTLSRYVSAPLVNIIKPGSTAIAGRYAWWVGDEGVKAKYNITPSASSNAVATYKTLTPQRSGWEAVTGYSTYPNPNTSAAKQPLLKSVVSLPTARLLDSTMVGDPLNRAFHSATTDTFGILTDNLNGGLKLDFSPYLANGFPNSAIPNVTNSPIGTSNIIPGSVDSSIKGPIWNQLKDFAAMYKNLSSGKLQVTPATVQTPAQSFRSPRLTKGAMAPTIIEMHLVFGAKFVPVTPPVADTYWIYPCVKVAVALANPYPYPLKWTDALQLEFKSDTPTGNGPSRIYATPGGPARPYISTNDYLGNPTEASVLRNALFSIPAGELPAGEARAYTIAGPASVDRLNNDTNPVTVAMGPFSSSAPNDFKRCVLMKFTNTNVIAAATAIKLDMRESWTTSLLTAELKNSSGLLLRRIERFELDNAFFTQLQQSFTGSEIQGLTDPVPLHAYSFQMSQPGMNYVSLLPNGGNNGIRSSTLRTFMDYNFQAALFRKHITSYNPAPFFMESSNNLNALPKTAPGGDTGGVFTKNLYTFGSSALPWGRAATASVTKNILFGIPQDMVSIAQFQHADLTADDISVSIGNQPGNAVGNSYASPYLKREQVIQSRNDYALMGSANQSGVTMTSSNHYDIAYLLNTALWDSYYISTVQSTATPPLNERILKIDGSDVSSELTDSVKSAGHLWVNGAFNVNSTDKDAWKALLAGTKSLKHPADAAVSNDAMFPRSLDQTSPSKIPPTGTGDDSFSGYRRLTDAQLDTLADEITKQVRLRGPFVSLAEFINRAIVPLATNKDRGRSGALQSALDLSGANISPDGSKSAFSFATQDDKLSLQNDGAGPLADMTGTRATPLPNNDPDPVWAVQSRDLNPGAVASIYADRQMISDPTLRPEQGFRSTGIPGWVTQADVLQAIGPVITTRSDTFRVRAYGESLDSSGKVIAKAYCEAVVQRTPSYVDAKNNVASDRGAALNATNQTYGRQFKIVSFRWLSPNEI